MKQLKIYATITFILGLLSIIGIVLSHLALTDINHGEVNADIEWKVVQVGFVIIILFHVFVFMTLYRLFIFLKKENRIKNV
ncbi:hypothetical protein ACFLSV_04905 [Bacteroidota bacterium]